MAGYDPGFVRQGEQAGLDGVDDLLGVAAGKVGAADAAGKERIASEDHVEWGEVKTDGALSMAGGMEDPGWVGAQADMLAISEDIIRRSGFRGFDTYPRRLFGHDLELGEVVFIEKDGGAGQGFEFDGSADVVDVSVRNQNLLEGEAERVESAMDAGDFVTRIDDDGFAGLLVGQNGAVALEGTDRKRFENHWFIVGRFGPEKQPDRRCGVLIYLTRWSGLPRGFASGSPGVCQAPSRVSRSSKTRG